LSELWEPQQIKKANSLDEDRTFFFVLDGSSPSGPPIFGPSAFGGESDWFLGDLLLLALLASRRLFVKLAFGLSAVLPISSFMVSFAFVPSAAGWLLAFDDVRDGTRRRERFFFGLTAGLPAGTGSCP
jgi:hypothetical protein